MEDARREIVEYGITEKEILEDGNELHKEAYFPPIAPDISYRIYGFLRQNDHHVIVAGGMAHVILGLDKSRLAELAPHYGFEYSRIIPYVQRYESRMLERQSRLQAMV